MTTGLILTYRGLSVTIRQLTSNSWPRTRIETPEISRTAYGAATERGYFFEAPHIWAISAVLNDEGAELTDAGTLDAIYDLWQQNGGDIVLDDYTRPYREESPRTRELASGGAVITVGDVINYPAKFNVRFQAELSRAIKNDREVIAEFTLIETTVRPI